MLFSIKGEEEKKSSCKVELIEEKLETKINSEPTEPGKIESKIESQFKTDKVEDMAVEEEEEAEKETEAEDVKKNEPPVEETFTSTNAYLTYQSAFWLNDTAIYNRLEKIIAMFEANGEWPQPQRPLQPLVGTSASSLLTAPFSPSHHMALQGNMIITLT